MICSLTFTDSSSTLPTGAVHLESVEEQVYPTWLKVTENNTGQFPNQNLSWLYKQPCSLYPNHIRICEAEPPHTQGGTQDSWHLLRIHRCSCGRCSRSSCRGRAQCTTRRDLRQRHRPRNSSGHLIASTKHFKYIEPRYPDSLHPLHSLLRTGTPRRKRTCSHSSWSTSRQNPSRQCPP